MGDAKGESGGTGEGDSEGRPSELRELPLGWRRRLKRESDEAGGHSELPGHWGQITVTLFVFQDLQSDKIL